ncbi:hypothetical protein DERP_003089 [Dermatophagoides pteronyssinus]|uniref:Uncharacterized protein n=1 Tax=Dermatophagoides pteronyssinus TaxID=6956 RepID=A0ABQ8JII9_DERPT|nr:hypothetical protein DERP_003089 [Dermatophagoides pteronyssinus]
MNHNQIKTSSRKLRRRKRWSPWMTSSFGYGKGALFIIIVFAYIQVQRFSKLDSIRSIRLKRFFLFSSNQKLHYDHNALKTSTDFLD